jgi:hypothetical protein
MTYVTAVPRTKGQFTWTAYLPINVSEIRNCCRLRFIPRPDKERPMQSEGPVPKYANVFVLYGRGVQTGGNLAAHQLVEKVRKLGGNAFLTPSEGTRKNDPVAEYGGFDAPEAEVIDSHDTLVVSGEYSFKSTLRYRQAKIAVWWLSADKSVPFRVINALRARNPREIRKVLATRVLSGQLWAFVRLVWFRKPRTIHFTQSIYAKKKIKKWFNIRSEVLSDYLYPRISTFTRGVFRGSASITVAYNPKKGGGPKARALMALLPEVNWIPILGLTHKQAAEVLSKCNLFLDLGLFPGKDRLPREAVALGTPILLSDRGSASENEDFPLEKKYRLNLAEDWRSKAIDLIREISMNRSEAVKAQRKMLEQVRNEESQFEIEVQSLFFTSRS